MTTTSTLAQFNKKLSSLQKSAVNYRELVSEAAHLAILHAAKHDGDLSPACRLLDAIEPTPAIYARVRQYFLDHTPGKFIKKGAVHVPGKFDRIKDPDTKEVSLVKAWTMPQSGVNAATYERPLTDAEQAKKDQRAAAGTAAREKRTLEIQAIRDKAEKFEAVRAENAELKAVATELGVQKLKAENKALLDQVKALQAENSALLAKLAKLEKKSKAA